MKEKPPCPRRRRLEDIKDLRQQDAPFTITLHAIHDVKGEA